MNSKPFAAVALIFRAIVIAVALPGVVPAADRVDIEAEFQSLEAEDSQDPQAWFRLAQEARAANDLSIAEKALDKAAEFGIGPVREGIEKARILVVGKNPQSAVTELEAVAAAGFTTVGVLTADTIINSLAGDPDYDALIDQMSLAAYPCAYQPHFQDFDFWIGEWNVHLANGTPAGSNVIRSIERGCALSEHWTSASGGTGMSINYFDASTEEWVQIWNAEGGSQIVIRGGLTDDGMAMTGYINYVGNGSTAPFRALWTPLPDGRVRQFFEQSNDGGKSWVPWFEGFYTRRAR